MKKIACMAMCVALLFVFTTPSAFAQSLGSQWFQVNVKGKGFIFHELTEEYSASTFNVAGYLHIYWNTVELMYNTEVWTTYNGPNWDITHYGAWDLYGANEDFLSPGIIGINDNTGNSWRIGFIANLKLKKDSSGNIKGITFTDSGCIVEDSRYTNDSNLRFSGGCKIKGKKVDTSKLPFNP